MKAMRFRMKDLRALNEWHSARGMGAIMSQMLPTVGYIVDDVCAGFLYQTDSKIAFLDGFISNPHTDADLRKEALDMVTDSLITSAQERGFKLLMAYTGHPSIKKRCWTYGFKHKGQSDLYLREV